MQWAGGSMHLSVVLWTFGSLCWPYFQIRPEFDYLCQISMSMLPLSIAGWADIGSPLYKRILLGTYQDQVYHRPKLAKINVDPYCALKFGSKQLTSQGPWPADDVGVDQPDLMWSTQRSCLAPLSKQWVATWGWEEWDLHLSIDRAAPEVSWWCEWLRLHPNEQLVTFPYSTTYGIWVKALTGPAAQLRLERAENKRWGQADSNSISLC